MMNVSDVFFAFEEFVFTARNEERIWTFLIHIDTCVNEQSNNNILNQHCIAHGVDETMEFALGRNALTLCAPG